MAKKENQRILLTKRMLQEGLIQLLETKSLDAISVTELCRVSGINRATFYNHYNSPQDLLDDIEARVTADLKKIIGDPQTYTDIVIHVEAVCTYFYENSRTMLILNKCHADEDINKTLYDLNRNFQIYRMNSKYTSTLGSDGIHLVSVFFYSGCFKLLLEWLKNDIPLTPKEVAHLMIRVAEENFVEKL